MRRRWGFTLIELLVVIAIIAILAAILFPVFLEAQASARLSACVNNMKQMGVAVNLYIADNNGTMPQATNIWNFSVIQPPDQPAWNDYFTALSTYLKSPSYAICPAGFSKWIAEKTRNIYYYGGNKNIPSPFLGATYTPTMWLWKKADPRLTGQGLPSHYLPGFRAEMPWSQRGDLRKPDAIDYTAYMGTPRRSEVVILFCMSGTWITFSHIPDLPPDHIVRGPHGKGTPVLFADMHSGLAGPVQVGYL